MLLLLFNLAHATSSTASCATVDALSTSGVGGRFTFAAEVPNWKVGARIRVNVALEYNDGEGAADCDAKCADEDDMDRACGFCSCSACPLCSIGRSDKQKIGSGCHMPGNIVSCSNAKVLEREAFGSTILRLGSPIIAADHRFGCTVTAPTGAKHTRPTISCVDPLPGPPAPPPQPSKPPPPPHPPGAAPRPVASPPPPPLAAAPPLPPRNLSPAVLEKEEVCRGDFTVRADVLEQSTDSQVLHVLALPTAKGTIIELRWPSSTAAPQVISSWGAEAADGSLRSKLRFQLDGTRTYFALVTRGSLELPRACIDDACGHSKLTYAAKSLPRPGGTPTNAAVVTVSPWAPGATIKLRYSSTARPEVVRAHSSQLVPSSNSKVLLLRLDQAAPADDMLVLETTTPPLGLYAPLEVACGGDREESAYDQPPRPHGLTCQSVHASGSNLRRSQPRPQWCHELKPPAGSFVAARAHCEKHYYQLDSSWLVRCTARMGDYSKCDASDLPLDCNPAPSLPPPAPPVWVEHADECTHLLRPPEVEATSSASFRIRPAFSAPPVPRCELGLKINVEWRRGGSGAWRSISAHKAIGPGPETWHVENVRCGDVEEARCSFRVRPDGWADSSEPSELVAGVELAPMPKGVARLEASFLTGKSGMVRMSRDADRARLAADVATVLRLPSAAFVRIVEVREAERMGSAAVVFDLHPTPTRNAERLVSQLASLLPEPRSKLYGGDVTQYLDRTLEVLRLSAGGLAEPIEASDEGEEFTAEASGPSALVYLALLALLAGLVAVFVAYAKGLSWAEAYSMYVRRLGGGGGAQHYKLPSEETALAGGVVEFTNVELAEEEEARVQSSRTEAAKTLAEAADDAQVPEEPEEDEALQRARRLIAALGTSAPPKPITLGEQVDDGIRDLQEVVEEEDDGRGGLDGAVLLI